MAIKPILFNTEMVRAILNGRKCCTRRVVKFPVNRYTNNVPLADKIVLQELRCDKANFLEEPFFSFGMNLPYQPGDILYVRETWCGLPVNEAGHFRGHPIYYYRADGDLRPEGWRGAWHPSIHMPKEAARIWLKVTDVRVERLQEITEVGIQKEGVEVDPKECVGKFDFISELFLLFQRLWESTIKKSDLDRYGWNANPYVWVIEFERCEKPEDNQN